MPNKALAKAIIDSGKKKKTVARLVHMEPWELSKILHDDRPTTPVQRERFSKVLGRPESELFPSEPDASATPTSPEATA